MIPTAQKVTHTRAINSKDAFAPSLITIAIYSVCYFYIIICHYHYSVNVNEIRIQHHNFFLLLSIERCVHDE